LKKKLQLEKKKANETKTLVWRHHLSVEALHASLSAGTFGTRGENSVAGRTNQSPARPVGRDDY
jgi:hypothetical protein